ncbi:MAG: hypothetical protein JO069_02660 [Verrucomicrobia bacterium]|nr:hypothetical protein [Verrucomicrobiota bacterium]
MTGGKRILVAGLLSFVTAISIPARSDPAVTVPGSLLSRSSSENLGSKRYVTAGNRAYEVGTLNGAFPPIGWHIKGRMNGVWAPPVKLLDSYRFLIGGQALPTAHRFTSGTGYVEFEYPEIQGLQITRLVFAPDGIPAVLVRLTLRNASNETQSFRLTLETVSDLISAYPWSTYTKPTADQVRQPDRGSFEPLCSGLLFKSTDGSRCALVSGSPQVLAGPDSARFTGASLPSPAAAPPFLRALGQLSWQVRISADHELKIWFSITGPDPLEAYSTNAAALLQPEALLRRKLLERDALLNQSRAEIPDGLLQAAFDWAKLNLAEMRRVVTNVAIRDTQGGTLQGAIYPPPLATFASLSGFVAGYPDYPWYFGTDGAYTVFPLVAAGQFEAAKDHLRLLQNVSRAVNGRTGKVLHEIVTDGSIYYGTNGQPGDINETAQFATAVATLWRWSGDNRVRDDHYQFILDGLHYLTDHLDSNGDGWPEGEGIVENTGMGAEKLDVAVYTIRALHDLAEMAAARDDRAVEQWAADKAEALLGRFEDDWWIPDRGLYADSLVLNHEVPADFPAALGTAPAPITKLQQLYWTTATPMETGLARLDHADAAFPTLESPACTGINGMYQAGLGGGPDGKGDLQACAHTSAVMAMAEANYGRVDESLRYVLDVARQLDLEQPGALPEQMPSPDYPMFPFRPFTRRAMVMQAWSSYGVIYPVICSFLGVQPHAPKRVLTVIPHLPGNLPRLSVAGLRVGNETVAVAAECSGKRYATEVNLPAGYRLEIGHTLPLTAAIEAVTLNGQPTGYEVHRTRRGNEVIAQTEASGTYRLIIQTR